MKRHRSKKLSNAVKLQHLMDHRNTKGRAFGFIGIRGGRICLNEKVVGQPYYGWYTTAPEYFGILIVSLPD